MPGRRQFVAGQRQDLGGRALPYRPVPHPCLAEAAAPGAAPHDFHPGPIVNTGDQRHQARRRVRGTLQPGHRPSPDPAARPRDEDAVDAPQAALRLGSRRSPASCRRHLREDLREQLLPVADRDRVHEAADRREVGAGRAAGEHEGVLLGTHRGVQGDAGQMEHLQQVRVVELVLKRHRQKMGVGYRSPRLQGQERDVPTAHLGDRVDPRQVGPFDPDSLLAAREVVKDLDGLVRDGDLVGVGEAKDHPQFRRFSAESRSGARLLAYEPRRLPDAGEHGLERAVVPRCSQRLIEPASAITLLVEAGAPFSK